MESPPKSDRLNLRVTSEMRRLLQLAADLENKNLTAFVLDAARMRAEQALADRSRFSIPPEQFQAFMAALERPERDQPALRRLTHEPSIVEQSDGDSDAGSTEPEDPVR